MASPINVIINAAWRGAQDVQRAKRDLASIEDGSKKGARGLNEFAVKAGIAVAALGAVNVAADRAYTSLERGAGLELTRKRFDNLAISIGTTGQALDEKIGAATAGMLTNAQQMALATNLIALELATTEDQAVRLSRVVTELDQDIGELSLALVNQTTRRFDQLNVSAVGFEERLEALKEQGLDTQEAFTEAFLQQAEAQIERVGGKSESAAGDIARFNAAVAGIKDSAELSLVSLVRFSGGFENLENTAQTINTISDAIERLSDMLNGLNLSISGPQSFLSDPAGTLLNRVFSFGTGEVVQAITQTEDFNNVLGELKDTLSDLGRFFGLVTDENKELAAAMDKTTEAAERLLKITDEIPSRGGFEPGGSAGNRSAGTPPVETFGTIQERINLFQDFQDDLTDINTRGQEERAAIEEQYERQRTQVVEDYNRQRAEEEEDWRRRQLRQEQDLQRSIADVRENAAEAEADAREQTNNRLADLERDHLRRIKDIIDNANLQLTEAAGRLDAAAVARIIRQRDAALDQEQQNYNDQRQEIEAALDEQLRAIQENMAERIEDLEEFHNERQAREAEDRAIRLQRLEEAHRRELSELEQQRRDRLLDLKEQIRRERAEVTAAYMDAYEQLTQHWSDRQELEAQWQASILEQERQWWEQRSALVGGGGTSGTTGGGDTAGGGTDPTGEQRPSRNELFDLVKQYSLGAGYTEQFVENLLQAMKTWTDRQVAIWLERAFGIDIPGYATGTSFVPRTGLAMLHRGERVLNPTENRSFTAGQGLTVNNNIYPSAGMDENALAAKVQVMTERAILRAVGE